MNHISAFLNVQQRFCQSCKDEWAIFSILCTLNSGQVTGRINFINGVLHLFIILTLTKWSLDGFVVGVRFINTAAVVPLWV